MKLQTKFYLGIAAAFLVLAAAVSAITVFLVDNTVVKLSTDRVRLNMNSALMIFNNRLNALLNRARFLAQQAEDLGGFSDESKFARERLEVLGSKLEGLKKDHEFELDMLNLTTPDGHVILRSGALVETGETVTGDPLLKKAVATREAASGIILLSPERLEAEGSDLLEKCLQHGGERTGMLMGAAVPVVTGGEFWAILEAGTLLNGATDKVDAIRNVVFEKKEYKGKPVGTATLFMKDFRISTNVIDGQGKRAIGTRASPEVAAHVLERGLSWTGRALVVDTWYLSRYDPILDPDQNIIGMLYVGELEQQYVDMRREAVLLYLLATLGGMALGFVVFIPITKSILGPIRKLSHATEQLAGGDLTHRIGIKARDEVGSLSRAFDRMAEELENRRKEIHAKQEVIEAANEELRQLNKNYMDLLGFVSHELLNPLASAIMGLYAVKDGYLGPLSEPQERALESVGRSLDYFKEIVKSYLDLSRLEKGEIVVHAAPVALRPVVIAPVIEGLERGIEDKKMALEVSVPEAMAVEADKDLLRIVVDNLVSNAIKYGREGGTISIEAVQASGQCILSVANEGEGIPADKIPLLFRKFSRVHDPKLVGKKGTGLGLYICKEIIEKHGGRIWVESEQGKWAKFTVSLPGTTRDRQPVAGDAAQSCELLLRAPAQ
jgi:two-component system NtrC family sensor kinase